VEVRGEARKLIRILTRANQMKIVAGVLRRQSLQQIADVRADAEIANSPDVKRNLHG
jgi:hypothetical protein